MEPTGLKLVTVEHQARYCLGCGYNVVGLPSGACPECGRAFVLDDPGTYTLDPDRAGRGGSARGRPSQREPSVIGPRPLLWGVLVLIQATSVVGVLATAAGLEFPERYSAPAVLWRVLWADVGAAAANGATWGVWWFVPSSLLAWSILLTRRLPARAQHRMLLAAVVVPLLGPPTALMGLLAVPLSPWLTYQVLVRGADGEFYEDGGLIFTAYSWWCIANSVLLFRLGRRAADLPPWGSPAERS